MKAEAIERFSDLKEGKIRKVGDVFEVTQKRFDELKALKLVKAAKVTEERKSSKKKAGE